MPKCVLAVDNLIFSDVIFMSIWATEVAAAAGLHLHCYVAATEATTPCSILYVSVVKNGDSQSASHMLLLLMSVAGSVLHNRLCLLALKRDVNCRIRNVSAVDIGEKRDKGDGGWRVCDADMLMFAHTVIKQIKITRLAVNSVKDRSPCIGAMHTAGCDSTMRAYWKQYWQMILTNKHGLGFVCDVKCQAM